MKVISSILWLLLGSSVVAGGILCAQILRELRPVSEAREERQQELRIAREEASDAGIKYRGYMDSLSEIPDSLRMKEAGPIVKQGETHRKKVFQAERQVRELERLVRKDDREIEALESNLRRRLILFGGAAVVFLAGALITRWAAIRS